MSIKAYNPVIYQKLGDIGAQSKVITRQDIDGLGKIIVKHGYGNHVCVVIAHRHFDLDDSEVMYEVVDSDRRISQPRPLFDILAEKAQPNLLSCSLDGFWYPVGYEESAEVLPAWNDKIFLAEAAKYLINANLVDKLAIASRRSADLKNDGIVFVEENLSASRKSIVRPTSPKEMIGIDAIPTTYAFTINGTVNEESCVVCVCIVNDQTGHSK